MRLSRSLASATAAVCLVMSLSYEAMSYEALPYEALSHTRVQEPRATASELFGASCRSKVTGSHVTTYCHNPYPRTDGVRLHIECDRWWDLDTDSAEVEVGPAQTVRLTGRCWKEVRSVWVSHRKLAR